MDVVHRGPQPGNYLWSGHANQADILPDDIYSLGGIAVYLATAPTAASISRTTFWP